jgi:dienelactone hydrolase
MSALRFSSLVVAAAWFCVGAQAGTVKESKDTFESGGKKITVELFEPDTAGKHPVVIVLHGAEGMSFGGINYRIISRRLAQNGYVAIFPHYFERTDTMSALGIPAFVNFKPWLGTIGELLTYAGKRPNVDEKRVGLLGLSLGAYLSLSTAAKDARVTAVVEYFGGLPDVIAKTTEKMPPTMILHGDADKLVPVEEAYRLEKLCKEKGWTYEMKIYPGGTHGLRDFQDDASKRTLEFFAKYLQAPATPAK